MSELLEPSYAPVHLAASGNFVSGASGGVNKDALVNPTGLPLEILAIKFQLRPATGPIDGSAMGVRLDYLANACTNGFIPINSLCKAIADQDATGLYAGFLNFVYKPSRPILLPPRGVLVPQFQHFGLTKQNISVRVSYGCRAILTGGPPRKKISLPYVAVYRSKVFDAWGAADTDASTEVDLCNPYDQPLNVDRFVGRLAITAQDGSTVSTAEDANFLEDFFARMLQVRMTDSFGEPVVQDFTTFSQVFSKLTRSWEVPHILGRQAYYLAFLNKLAPTFETNVRNAQVAISMIGWRDIPYGGAA